MSLLIDKEMPCVCKKCKEQGKLIDGLYHVHTEDYSINAYCDGDPSTGCPILGEIPDGHGRIVDLDKVLDWLINEDGRFSMATCAKIDNALKNAPVIMEASE